MKSAFISHNWRDKPLARKIASTLKHFGIRVWIDEAEIKLGDSLIEKIRLGIDKMDYLIALISKDSIKSEWVKKELDLAMNQEIEGRTVKVLPILCDSDTELPSFLKGKLYADMSSNKAFKNSLPILLDRLGVSEKIIREIDEKGYKTITEKSKKINGDLDRLINGESSEKYKLLKSYKNYDDIKKLEENKDLFDAIIELTKEPNKDYVRYEALKCFGRIGDPNYADKIETLLFDQNPNITGLTIEALSSSNAKISSLYILDLLKNVTHPLIKKNIWNYFSNVSLDDDSDVLSLIWILKKELETDKEGNVDPGKELKTIKILLNQWNGNRDSVFEELIKYFKSPHSATKITLLKGIADVASAEELWIERANLKEDLKKIMKDNLQEKSSSYVTALICKIGFLWYHFRERDLLWNSILKSDLSSCLESFLDELEEYRLKYIFDDDKDIKYISLIIDKLKENKSLKIRLCNILTEIGNQPALEELSKHKEYNPIGSEANQILIAISKLTKLEWKSEYNFLLENALSNCHGGSENMAFSLLAKFKAGKSSKEELIKEFPQKWSQYISNKYELTKLLNEIKTDLDSNEKKKIARIISKLENKNK